MYLGAITFRFCRMSSYWARNGWLHSYQTVGAKVITIRSFVYFYHLLDEKAFDVMLLLIAYFHFIGYGIRHIK
jgi:hypothetical protein